MGNPIKNIYDKYNLNKVGTFEQFQEAISDPKSRRNIYDKYLSSVGTYEQLEEVVNATLPNQQYNPNQFTKINSYLGSLESNNDYKAINDIWVPRLNRTSKATGKYQHIWDLHKPTIQKLTGISDRQDYLNNPQAQEKVQQAFNQEYMGNLPELRALANKNGLNFSDEELVYLRHHSGLGGARKYLAGIYVEDHKGLEGRLIYGREKGFTKAVENQQIAQQNKNIAQNVNNAKTLDYEAKTIAEHKVKEQYSKMNFFEKLSTTYGRKGVLGVLGSAISTGPYRGYNENSVAPTSSEIEAAKLDLLSSKKYEHLITDEESVDRLLKGSSYKTPKEHIKVGNDLEKQHKEDVAEDWGPLDNLSSHEFKTIDGVEYVNITPGKFKIATSLTGLDAKSTDIWLPIDQVKKLTTHPANNTTQSTVGKRLYNEKLNSIQADIAKRDRYIVDNVVNKGNNYRIVLENSINRLEKELEANYPKDKDGNITADQNDPLFKTYQEKVNQYNQSLETLKQYEPNVKVASLFDSNKKARIKALDEDLKNLNIFESAGNSIAYRLGEAGDKIYNLPRSTAQFLASGVNAALDTDLLTTSQISDAWNDNKIKDSASSKAIRKTFELPNGTKLEYAPNGELIGLLDNNDYSIDISKEDLAKLAETNKADYSKASMDVNWGGVASGVGDLLTDLPLMMIGSTQVAKALGALGKTATGSRYAGLGKVANGLANSDRMRTFAGTFTAFYDNITEGAIKEGGLTTGREIGIAGFLKTGLESTIEMINPIEGKILSGKIWDSLSTAQVKDFTKRVLGGEHADDIIKEIVRTAKTSFTTAKAKNIAAGVVDTAIQGAAESLEEVAAAILEPQIVNTILNNWLDTTYNTKINLEEVIEGALVGFAGGFMLGGIGTLGSTIATNSNDAILNNSTRASLQHRDLFKTTVKDLFDTKKQQITEQYQNDPEALSKAITTLEEGYNKVTKVHDNALSVVDSRSIFKESDIDGFIPSKGMQTFYSALALKKGFLDSIDIDQVQGLDVVLDDVNNKLKDLDLFKKNRFENFTTLSSVNSKIPKEDQLTTKVLQENSDRIHTVIQNKIDSLKKNKTSEPLKIKAIEAEIFNEISKIKHEKASEKAKAAVTQAAELVKKEEVEQKRKEEELKADAELQGLVEKGTADPKIVNEKLAILNSDSDIVVQEAVDNKNFEFIDKRLEQLEKENQKDAHDYLNNKKNELKNQFIEQELNNVSSQPLLLTDSDSALLDSVQRRYNDSPNLKEAEEEGFDNLYNDMFGDGENIVPPDQNLLQKLQNPDYKVAAQAYFDNTHHIVQAVPIEAVPTQEEIEAGEKADILVALGVTPDEEVLNAEELLKDQIYESLDDTETEKTVKVDVKTLKEGDKILRAGKPVTVLSVNLDKDGSVYNIILSTGSEFKNPAIFKKSDDKSWFVHKIIEDNSSVEVQEKQTQILLDSGKEEHTIFGPSQILRVVYKDGTEVSYNISKDSQRNTIYTKEGETTPTPYEQIKGIIKERVYHNREDAVALEDFLNNYKENDPIYYEVSDFNGSFAVKAIIYLKDKQVVSSETPGASKHYIGYLSTKGSFFPAIKSNYKKGDVIQGTLQSRDSLQVKVGQITATTGIKRGITIDELKELIESESIGIVEVPAGKGGGISTDEAIEPFVKVTKQDGTTEIIPIDTMSNAGAPAGKVFNQYVGSVAIKIGGIWYKLDTAKVADNERNTTEVRNTLLKLIDSYNIQKAQEKSPTPNQNVIKDQIKLRKEIVNTLIGLTPSNIPAFQNRDNSSKIEATENFKGQKSLIEEWKTKPGFDVIDSLIKKWKLGDDITKDPEYETYKEFFDSYFYYEELNGISYISIVDHGDTGAFLYKGVRYSLSEDFNGYDKLIEEIFKTRSQVLTSQLGPEATEEQLSHVASLLKTIIANAKISSVNNLPVKLSIDNKPVVKSPIPVETKVVSKGPVAPVNQPIIDEKTDTKETTEEQPKGKISNKDDEIEERFKLDNSNTITNETELAKVYLTQRFKEIDINIDDETLNDLAKIYGLADNSVRGAFHNATVTLASNTSLKTAKHEAFHVLFNLFLNPEQRDSILDQAFERYGKELGINKEQYDQAKQNEKDNKVKFKVDDSVNYNFKAVDIISKNLNKIKQWENNKSINEDILYKKLGELGISKDQLELLRNSEGNTIEEKLVNFAVNYSYTIEINTAKEKAQYSKGYETTKSPFGWWNIIDGEGINYKEGIKTKEEAESLVKEVNSGKYFNTQHYSNLTVPGGTSYTEQEIATPAITPSIKGHAQFSTDNGIGWFRSDDKKSQLLESNKDIRIGDLRYSFDKTDMFSPYKRFNTDGTYDSITEEEFNKVTKIAVDNSKTRRILEVQSDLFQKGRDRKTLIDSKDGIESEEYIQYKKETKNLLENNKITIDEAAKRTDDFKGKKYSNNSEQFLQLLNKDNNWVTFFVKSIIQDSAKKGYEKVLFPTGNTASKVEGHNQTEEFKQNRISMIKSLKQDIANLKGITIEEEYDEGHTYYVARSINKDLQLRYKGAYDTKNQIQKKIDSEIKNIESNIEVFKQEIINIDKNTSPIYNFYENTVTNILKKQGYKAEVITDEYGNTWNEIKLDNTSTQLILLKTDSKEFYESQNILTRLEEKLAELYEDYDSNLTTSWVYKNKDKYPGLYNIVNKIYTFVNDTYQKIKTTFRGKNSIEDLFYQLDRNIYGKNLLGIRKQSIKEIFNRNINTLTEDTKFKIDINGWSRENIKFFSQFLVRDLFDLYLDTNYNTTNLNHVVDNLVDKTPLELFNDFIFNIEDYTNAWVKAYPKANVSLIDQIRNTYTGENSNDAFIAQVNNDFKIYRGLIVEKSQELEDTELEDNLEESDSEEGSDQNDGRHTEEVNGEQYDKAKVVDPSTKISKRLKELLSNLKILTLKTDKDGDWFGLTKKIHTQQYSYVELKEAQNILIHDLANSNSETFIDNLNKVSKKHYWVQGIFKQILGDTEYILRKENGIFVELTSEDMVNTNLQGYWILASLFGNIGSNRTNDPKYVELSRDQSGNIAQASMYRLRSNGIKEVISTKIKGTILALTTDNLEDYKTIVGNYIKNKNYEALSALLIFWDIKITEDNVNQLLESPSELNNGISKVMDFLNKGVLTNTAIENTTAGLKLIANATEKYVSEIGDLSFTNVNNKKEFGHIPSNYITRQFDKIKNNVKEWVDSKRFHKTKDGKLINILFTGQLPILKDLERLTIRDIRDFIELSPDGYYKEKDREGTSYTKYTPKEMKSTVLNRFFASNRVPGFRATGNTQYGQFVGPTLADAPQRLFFNLPVYTNKDVKDRIFETILAEHTRVYYAKAQLLENSKVFDNYKTQSFTKYHLFPFMNNLVNSKKITNDWNLKPDQVLIVKAELDKYLNNAYSEFINSLAYDDLGKIDPEVGFIPNKQYLYEPADFRYHVALNNYYLNQFYYNSNLITLFSGDPAFYKLTDGSAAIEIGKRIKQINSPYTPGLTDSNKKLNFITLKDKEVRTSPAVLKAVTTLFKDSPYLNFVLKNFGFVEVSKNDTYDIESDSKYYTSSKENNLADAAAFHNIDRRVEILKNSGKYENVKHDKLFEALRNGTATAAQLAEVIQGVKPFAFGNTVNIINDVNGNPNMAIMEPIQLKDAEFLLVPQYAYQLKDGSMKQPDSLSSIDDTYFNKDLAKILYLMDTTSSNLVLFESASKATNRDIIDLDNLGMSEEAISREISYEYVGNQVDTPAKHLDKDVLVGTQVIKSLTANLGPEFENLANEFLLTLAADLAENGKKATARLHTDGKLDMKKVQKFLYDSKIDKNNAIELLKELELHADGDLLVPLELSGKTNEKLFNGIYKKASKLKTPGVSLINKAGVGFSDKLKMVFNEDGSLAYYEALVSPFSKKLLEFADENGIIDPNKLPKELTEMFLYRIPTEDKYSMIPIKIVGFLPGSVGGAIVLPPEITTISGLDFDVDKVYGMVRSFRTFKDEQYNKFVTNQLNSVFGDNSYTTKEITELLTFIEENNIETYDDYINLTDEELLDTKYDSVLAVLIPKLDQYTYTFNRNYENKTETLIKVIPSNENSTKGRANRRLDIIKQITSSKEFAKDLLFGGSKSNLSRLAKAKKLKDTRSIGDPSLQTDFAIRNTAGGRMIGIFASINAFHNLLQNSKEAFLTLEEPFSMVINGNNYELSEISTPEDTENNGKNKLSISKGLSEPLFASTEDIKDPVLQVLNLNEVTAGIFTTLLMLNVEFDDAVYYINTEDFRSISQQAVNNNESIKDIVNGLLADDTITNKGYLGNLKKIAVIGNELLTISQAIKIDNYNIGPDLTIVQNKIDSIKDLNQNIEAISGINNIIPKITVENNKYVVNKEGSGKLTLINQFAELLVQEINELTPVFNYLAPSFSTLRDSFKNILDKKRLYDSQIRTINHGVYDSIIQNTIFGADPSRYYKLLNDFPARFMSHSFVDSSINKHFFIKLIKTYNSNFYLLSLQNNFQLSTDEISDIKSQIEDLLFDEPDIANDLIDYIFILGTQFNANGLFKLIPAEYFNTEKGQLVRTAIKNAPDTVSSNLSSIFENVLKNNFNKIIFGNGDYSEYHVGENGLVHNGAYVYDDNIPVKNRKIPNDYIRKSGYFPAFIARIDPSYKVDSPVGPQFNGQLSEDPLGYKNEETPDIETPCKKLEND